MNKKDEVYVAKNRYVALLNGDWETFDEFGELKPNQHHDCYSCFVHFDKNCRNCPLADETTKLGHTCFYLWRRWNDKTTKNNLYKIIEYFDQKIDEMEM